MTAVGLAYDAVSGRFVFGDKFGRKLIMVADRSRRSQDLVRADSAGFHDIAALQIDDKRGDLWVASGAAADGSGTLHKLQLVSGRPLRSFSIAASGGPVDLVDLTVTRAGTVLVLDAASGRILALRPGAGAVETLARIDLAAPTSITIGGDDTTVYVAHRDGVSRIDLRGRRAASVKAPKSVSLAHLRHLRWHRQALIGVAADEGGNRIQRFDLNASGRAVTRAAVLASPAALTSQASVTIVGDDVLYLAPGGAGEFVAYRVAAR